MKTYLDFMRSIKASPVVQVNKRTGIECRMVLGEQLKFHDVGNQFPATTTKQLAFKGMRGELLGFFRGYTNAADFRALNCQVWNQNANETPAWLANIYRKGEDDLGVIYGKQWTAWKDRRIAETSAERDRLVAAGYTVRMMSEYIQDEDGKHYHWLMEREINQLENVLRMLLTDPTDRRMIVSGWNVAELDMMALPPCFVPKTKVLTDSGYKNIDDIKVKDIVISASGVKRSVDHVWATPYTGKVYCVTPRYQKHPIKCTPNHPFLVKGRGWVDAKDLTEDDFIAIPKIKFKGNHSFEYSVKHNKGGVIKKTHKLTKDDYFFLGYFMGDGWCSKTNALINVAIAEKDVDKLLPKLRLSLKISKKIGKSNSVSTYNTRSQKWIHICREFGYKADGKKIPEWVFSSSDEMKKSFIDGYLAADGSKGTFNEDCATTTSHDLAFGLQLLFSSFGKAACVSHQERLPTCLIEGRTVNQKSTYFFQSSGSRNNYGTTSDDENLWIGVKKIETEDYSGVVYNLDVEEDHTYIVSNIATHNCHMDYRFSAVPDHTNPDGPMVLHVTMTIRSWDVYLGGPFNISETALFLCLMARLAGMTPGSVTVQATNAHLYSNHMDKVDEQLMLEPRALPKLVISDRIQKATLETIAGIFERIEPDDMWLEGYDPIKWDSKAPMAV